MSRYKRRFEVAKQRAEWPGQRLPPRDENIVITGQPIKRKQLLGRSPQPPLCAVAGYRIAGFFACGESDPDSPLLRCRRRTKLKRHARSNAPYAAGGAKEILPLFEAFDFGTQFPKGRPASVAVRQADNLFRPCARRRDNTLRPPTVAMRARKPCRRLRTILLG
jgi:hypothetical protein